MEVMMDHDISYRRAYTHSWQNFSDRGGHEKTVPEITEKDQENSLYLFVVSGSKWLQVLAIKKDLRNMGFKGVSMRLAGECAWHTPLAAHTVTLLISESAYVSKSFFMPENQ